MTIAARLTCFGFSVLLATAAVAQAPAQPAQPETPHIDRGAPVVLDGETLYYVYNFMGVLSPEDRASAANRKLKLLADDPFFSTELFSSEEVDGTTRILYGDSVIGLVTQEDVAAVGEPSAKIAAERIDAITKAIAQHRQRQLPRARVRAAVVIVGATAALILLLLGLRRGYRQVAKGIRASLPDARATAFGARMGLHPEQVITLELRLLGFLRILVTLVLLLIYLQIAFSFLPLTRGYALTVLDYLLAPLHTLWQGFLREIGNIFTILVLVVLTRYAL